MANRLSQAWGALWGTGNQPVSEPVPTKDTNATKNLSRIISPVQLERIRQDVSLWREALREAEQAWYPHRVKIQRMYQDTVLNGQVESCMERRKDLTLLRDFIITDEKGEEIDEWTKFFKTPWFALWMDYGLDALAYGYQLVSHGDLDNNQFKNLSIVKRQNISPDRMIVGSLVYSLSGISWEDEPYKDWHTYFSTPTKNAASKCGYGYLYSVAYYEIFLRNLTGANADYVQFFGQPYTIGKTTKTEEAERDEFAEMLASVGTNKWGMMDPDDTIELVESSNSGTGYQSYDNFETRCLKMISKIILGHADAMDSTAGKLGAEQGKDSPVAKALRDKKTKDGAYIENMFNLVLVPKLQAVGINFPVGAIGKFKNDEEEEETREKEDASNKEAAELMKLISDAGGKPNWEWFSKRTNIETIEKVIEEPEPEDEITEEEKEESKTITASIQNKLNNIYGTH